MHDQLPLGHQVIKCQPCHSHKRPSCGADDENRAHLLLCKKASRMRWGSNFTRETRLVCEKIGVCKELKELLSEGFVCCFADSNVEFERHVEWLHPITKCEDAVGWEQAFHGGFSNKWAVADEERPRMKRVEVAERNSGLSLIRRLKIWASVGVWKESNLARHRETEQEQAEKKKEICSAKLKMWYGYRD